MKTVKTMLINDLSSKKNQDYIMQVAQWRCQEWGKYINKTNPNDWYESICEAIKTEKQTLRIATDAKTEAIIGVLSLKKTNMEDDKQYENLGPWFSGAYIDPAYRKLGVMPLLAKELLEKDIIGKYPQIYVFSHDLTLAPFYQRFGGQIMHPSSGKSYSYKDKPIVLLKGEPKLLLKEIDAYVSQRFSVTESKGAREYTTEPRKHMETPSLRALGTIFNPASSSTESSSASSSSTTSSPSSSSP